MNERDPMVLVSLPFLLVARVLGATHLHLLGRGEDVWDSGRMVFLCVLTVGTWVPSYLLICRSTNLRQVHLVIEQKQRSRKILQHGLCVRGEPIASV